MTELSSEVARALDRDPISFPDLALKLADWFDESHAAANSNVYGTERWLSGRPDGIREIANTVSIGPEQAIIERLPEARASRFKGLQFKETNADDIEAIQSALNLLNDSDPLLATLAALVRSIHILEAEPAYDISHSDPEIPYTIFLSIPPASAKSRDIRVLESLIHEAMHLQLSLIEQICPLMKGEFFGYSPWQRRNRPAQGLLHGLYVFAVVHTALRRLLEAQSSSVGFIVKRLGEIEEEVSYLGGFDEGLTVEGAALAKRLITTITKP